MIYPCVLLCVWSLLSGCLAAPRSQQALQGAQAAPDVPGHGWTEGLVLGVRTEDTGLTVLFLNTYSQPDGLAPGVWHETDITPLGVPRDTIAILISGLLVLTHGWSIETCNLTVAFRAPGSVTLAGNYIFQTIEAAVFGGQRSNAAAMIPVKNGKIELQWNQSSKAGLVWPEVCAYGVNLRVQAYVRKGMTVRVEPVS